MFTGEHQTKQDSDLLLSRTQFQSTTIRTLTLKTKGQAHTKAAARKSPRGRFNRGQGSLLGESTSSDRKNTRIPRRYSPIHAATT